MTISLSAEEPIDPVPDPLARPTQPSKGGMVFHRVRRDILLALVRPGEQLLEQRIAAAESCSQGTVREALLRLEQEGLVRRRGYRGTIVVKPSDREVAEMVRIRENIECIGLRRSVSSFPEKPLSRLEHFATHMDRAGESGDAYRLSELDRGFHLCLLQEANLPALEPIFTRCMLNQHRLTINEDEQRPPNDRCGDEHRLLIDAVRGGDPETAVQALRDHIRSVLLVGAPQLLEL